MTPTASSSTPISATTCTLPCPDATGCTRCPRLAAHLQTLRTIHPEGYHNAPVPSFGPQDAPFLIVGLAPGRHGANRTGRPFTGDFAGDLLYATLTKFGFTRGTYSTNGNDDLALTSVRITNAVRCVPPANKPLPTEITTCNSYLRDEIAAMPNLRIILSLGRISHDAVLTALGQKKSACKFGHGAVHTGLSPRNLTLIDSYHCSRYNTQTKRLTPKMFEEIFSQIQKLKP